MHHHEIFSKFKCYSGEMDANFHYDFLGVRTRKSFAPWVWQDEKQEGITELPELSEDYFEWIDVLEAVTSAKGKFVMLELGACGEVGLSKPQRLFEWLIRNLPSR